VFGAVVTDAFFTLPALNGQGAGVAAYRPLALDGEGRFYLLCVAVLAGAYLLDRALTATKAGRALHAVRENELVAQAFAVNVVGYKLLAFALSGAVAGVAGGLSAFRVESFSDKNFTGDAGFNLALIFLVMVVVGGLGSRAGVIVASAFFGLLDPLLGWLSRTAHFDNFYIDHKFCFSSLIGAVLLLVTLLQNPGGTGQSLQPLVRWLAGGRFSLHADDAAAYSDHGGGDVRA
jgi:branched-chain amino acid transport system permease protein